MAAFKAVIEQINPLFAHHALHLDTGRLFPETYQLIDRTNMTYGINIEFFSPAYAEIMKRLLDHDAD